MNDSQGDGAGIQAKMKDKVDRLEIAATAILGIAAVLIAWSAYQASLWGGVQDTKNTESVRQIVDAADEFGRADATRSLDQLLFVDYLFEVDPDASDLLLSQMSDEGQIAATDWFENQETRPFDEDNYTSEVYGPGLEYYETSFVLFDEAAEANQNGDDYTLGATIISLVLFLAGVSLVLKGRVTRFVLVASSGTIVTLAGVYVATLPLA